MTETETEKFWAPIVEASLEDFRQLRLSPPFIDHDGDQIMIFGSAGRLAGVTRAAVAEAHDAAHVVIEVARAVAPKR